MEEGQKRQKSLRSRFRECFKPGVPQSLVPLDIWKRILLNTDPQSLGGMAQTSKPFEEVVQKDIRVNNWELARRYRKEGQIRLALKCLKSCVDHNHPEATFQLGYAYKHGGWGVERNISLTLIYLNKAIELGNEHALVYHYFLYGSDKLSTTKLTNAFALGVYHSRCLYDRVTGFKYFEQSAKQGDEFGQYFLCCAYLQGDGTDKNTDRAVEWCIKSAEQGYGTPQLALGRDSTLENRQMWLNKANAQKTKS